MHAGGIVYRNGKLHVPDTREDSNGNKAKKIYVFSIDAIQKVVESKDCYDYPYIIESSSSYDVPITPSFLSYDWDREQMLIGTFYDPDNKKYPGPPNLAWYTVGDVRNDSPYCGEFPKNIQGAASAKDPVSGKHILWIASSFGSNPNNKSRLRVTYIDVGSCSRKGNYTEFGYPPGLEDMDISGLGNIWMLTEFGPDEKKGENNRRIVFVTQKGKLMPIK